MAIYERTQRESAHVFSRVVDKSKVPSALSWAALGCVTASKGELNKVLLSVLLTKIHCVAHRSLSPLTRFTEQTEAN